MEVDRFVLMPGNRQNYFIKTVKDYNGRKWFLKNKFACPLMAILKDVSFSAYIFLFYSFAGCS